MEKELLNKYYKNACTEEELRLILEWFRTSAATQEGENLLFKLWEELADNEDDLNSDYERILHRIHHQINLKQSEELIEQSGQDVIRFRRRKQLIRIISKVAAIVFIPVFLFGLYTSGKYLSERDKMISWSEAYHEVFSSVDAITKVTLPDGSFVWLNHNTRLKYPAVFRGNSRTVELIGEGYFEVVHNPDIPFIVSTEQVKVVAHGTTFNICAYADDDRIETSLIEGILEFQRIDEDMRVLDVVPVQPAERVIFYRNDNKIISHVVEDDRYYAWKSGKLVFKNEPMEEVIKKLSRWFNVEIEIKDPELNDLTYTATFVNETLLQVMELLTVATPISYSMTLREKKNDETFSKQKVVLISGRKQINW